ncbi:MAG: tRNA lysidine(34) synthetase TilS [Lachnospiraceae bacterium]|nr:tRNA lysidine(34) synthetase TilS [Lachnospiraceae bacterium]
MDRKKIKDYISQYNMIRPGDTVIAAVSGGADSVALLFILSELSEEMEFRLLAVHVEHGIRGEESLADMRFTEELCAKRGVPLRVYHVDAPACARENGMGLEEAARKLRYEMLEEAARELQFETREEAAALKIALAHHQQDQAETVLFRLARGSGLNGLAGMQPVRQSSASEILFGWRSDISEIRSERQNEISRVQPGQQNGIADRQSGKRDWRSCTYIRPLLATPRSEIEEYLASRGQEYRVDSTNLDENYARNRIRSRVLPELSAVNAQAAAHIAQAAAQAAEISDYIAGEAARELERIATVEEKQISVEIPELSVLHPALQKELLRQALILVAGHEKDLTAGHVAQLLELTEKTSGKEICLPYQVKAVRAFDRLVLCRQQEDAQSAAKDIEKAARAAEATGAEAGVFEIGAEQLKDLKETGETLKITLSRAEEAEIRICGRSSIPLEEKAGEGEEASAQKYFDFECLKEGFAIRHRQPGDFFFMKDGHRKKLKQYMIDKKIPGSERPNLWLLARGSQVMWLFGGNENISFLQEGHMEKALVAEYKVY